MPGFVSGHTELVWSILFQLWRAYSIILGGIRERLIELGFNTCTDKCRYPSISTVLQTEGQQAQHLNQLQVKNSTAQDFTVIKGCMLTFDNQPLIVFGRPVKENDSGPWKSAISFALTWCHIIQNSTVGKSVLTVKSKQIWFVITCLSYLQFYCMTTLLSTLQ